MSVVAICRCKDEQDVLPFTLARTLDQVDHVIVEDNGSTDGTRDYLAGLNDDRLTVLDDTEVAYYQSAAMSRLAQLARERFSAQWVIPFDSDEAWYSPFGRIADVLIGHAGCGVATAALYDHVATGKDDEAERDPTVRSGWRRLDPAPLPKVACRPVLPVTIEQGNHAATYPAATVEGLLVVRHYAIRSADQMIRKARNGAAAYAATDLPENVGQHWRDWGRLTDKQLRGVFRDFYFAENPAADPTLIYDPAP